jgi:hypothetical protein
MVLHNESHFQKNIQGDPEVSFFSYLAPDEKRKTAQDVLCFIYMLNKAHVKFHLPEGAEHTLENWCSRLSGT